jgi:membrane protein implicated in regulation of membrane protease activity
MDWWMWIVGGILCLGVEVAQAGGFVFVFFGIAALIVGGLDAIGWAPELWQQSLLQIGLSTAGLVFFRRRLLHGTLPLKSPMDTLVGEIATTREAIDVGLTGKVELRGTVWTGHNPGPAPIALGQRCIITHVDGLTVWVAPQGPRTQEGES